MDENNKMMIEKNVVNKCWQCFESFRGIKTQDLQVIFLLLSAYKDNVLHESLFNRPENLGHDVVNKLYHSDKYFEIFQVYEEIIQLMVDNKLRDFFDIMNNLNELELGYLRSNFSEIFEILLERYLSIVSKKTDIIIQPQEVTSIIEELVQINENIEIYNPFAGLASYGLNLGTDAAYYGQELMDDTWALGMLRMFAHYDSIESYYSINSAIEHFRGKKIYETADSIDSWPENKKFDLVVATPPFRIKLPNLLKSEIHGEPYGYIENFLIEKGLNSLKENGQLITVLSLSFLFSSARKDRKLKEYLVTENLIESILLLPSGLFSNTSIPICIVTFKNASRASNYVKFIDGSSFHSVNKSGGKILNIKALLKTIDEKEEIESVRHVSLRKIEDNGFDLSVKRYFLEDFEGVKLSDLFQIEKGAMSPEMETYPMLRVKDILNASPYIDVSALSEIPSKRPPRFTTGEYLLVNTTGSKISSAISKGSQTVFFNQTSIQVLKLIDSEKVDLEYVYHVFHSEEVQNQIKGFTGGASQATRLRSKDLLSIKIPLPSLEEQKLYVINQLRAVIQMEEASLAKLKKDSGIDDADDISYLRHSLAGSVKNIRDSFSKVLTILENQVFNQNPELRNLTKTSRSKITLQKHLEIISSDLEGVKNTLNRTSIEIDVRTMNKTAIDFIDFIKDYSNVLKANRGSEFKVNFEYDIPLLENSGFKSIYINGDKEMLRTALDNVVENAVKHAFPNEKNPLIEFELMFDFESDNMLQLDIANNGKCIPENFTIDDLTRKGQRVGKNAGDGYGGYLIKEIIEAHGGTVDITDESGIEGFDYPRISTSFEITLPFTTNPEEYV